MSFLKEYYQKGAEAQSVQKEQLFMTVLTEVPAQYQSCSHSGSDSCLHICLGPGKGITPRFIESLSLSHEKAAVRSSEEETALWA